MSYKYPKNDPKWIKADYVEAAAPDGSYVNVRIGDEEFKFQHVDWSNPFMDKSKSDVTVESETMGWLKIWFHDADVVPYEQREKK